METCNNRLTVIGLAKSLDVPSSLGGKYVEVLECAASRWVWQFETNTPPLELLRHLSSRHPLLTFLLDYEYRRRKGLVKATQGRLIHHRVSY